MIRAYTHFAIVFAIVSVFALALAFGAGIEIRAAYGASLLIVSGATCPTLAAATFTWVSIATVDLAKVENARIETIVDAVMAKRGRA